MPLRHADPRRARRLRVCGLTLLCWAGAAMAADEPYLQLEARLVEEPYQWLLPDGTVVREGLSDNAARVTVAAHESCEDYVLEMIWGRFPVKVPARCWTLPAAQFESCVTIRPREDSAWQREQAESVERQDAARRQNRETRVAWAVEQVGAKRVPRILEAALAEHRRWLVSDAGRAGPDVLACGRLKPALAAAPAQDTLPRRAMLDGEPDAVAAYAQAARGGNWRAAGGLFDAMLADEDFESAQVIVAWLLKREIPAGYNKLGTLLAVTTGYDGAAGGGGALVEGLRRHAAWRGDPAAQMDLANLLEDAGDDANAARLRECAIAQNPALAR
nr:hypothetical protein [Pseudoxanthomonas sp.]